MLGQREYLFLNKFGKTVLRWHSPTQTSCKNLTLLHYPQSNQYPSHTNLSPPIVLTKVVNLLFCHIGRIFSHSSTSFSICSQPYSPLHYPTYKSIQLKVVFMAPMSMNPKSPNSLGLAKTSHFTIRYFVFLPTPSQCRRTDQFIRIQVQWQSASGRTVILEPI